jgi:S-adenosylmethionine hydrolase
MTILTFSSDFGTDDYIGGAAKGMLLRTVADIQLVDLSHQLLSTNYPQTAYVCKNAMVHFPPQTIHLILVNVFDESPLNLLVALHKGHYYCCVDNGLLSMILEEEPEQVVALSMVGKARNILSVVQVFADAIQQISQQVGLDQVGSPVKSITKKQLMRPVSGPNWIEAQILHIDPFENVVVNIKQTEFEAERKGRAFSIVFKRDEVIRELSETYSDVPPNEKLAFFNAAGYLEIAIHGANAAGLFGLQGYNEEQMVSSKIFYQTVKIFFE